MQIVYAKGTTQVSTPDGGRHTVHGGTHWDDRDPVVLANPNLFTSDPRFGLSYSVPPAELSEPPVEQVTGRAGERRAAVKRG